MCTSYPDLPDQTCFLIAYSTVVEQQAILRLALLHPKWDYQLAPYEKVHVIVPSDSTSEEANRSAAFLSESLLPPREIGSCPKKEASLLMANIRKNISIVADLFWRVAQVSRYVSNDLDFAVMLRGGQTLYAYGLSGDVCGGNFSCSLIRDISQSTVLSPEA
jgi:hypothetical protein